MAEGDSNKPTLEVPADSKVSVEELIRAGKLPGTTVTYEKNTGKVKIEIDPEKAKNGSVNI